MAYRSYSRGRRRSYRSYGSYGRRRRSSSRYRSISLSRGGIRL